MASQRPKPTTKSPIVTLNIGKRREYIDLTVDTPGWSLPWKVMFDAELDLEEASSLSSRAHSPLLTSPTIRRTMPRSESRPVLREELEIQPPLQQQPYLHHRYTPTATYLSQRTVGYRPPLHTQPSLYQYRSSAPSAYQSQPPAPPSYQVHAQEHRSLHPFQNPAPSPYQSQPPAPPAPPAHQAHVHAQLDVGNHPAGHVDQAGVTAPRRFNPRACVPKDRSKDTPEEKTFHEHRKKQRKAAKVRRNARDKAAKAARKQGKRNMG